MPEKSDLLAAEKAFDDDDTPMLGCIAARELKLQYYPIIITIYKLIFVRLHNMQDI